MFCNFKRHIRKEDIQNRYEEKSTRLAGHHISRIDDCHSAGESQYIYRQRRLARTVGRACLATGEGISAF